MVHNAALLKGTATTTVGSILYLANYALTYVAAMKFRFVGMWFREPFSPLCQMELDFSPLLFGFPLQLPGQASVPQWSPLDSGELVGRC